MKEYDCYVEAIDVVAEKINYLSDCRLSESSSAQPQRLQQEKYEMSLSQWIKNKNHYTFL